MPTVHDRTPLFVLGALLITLAVTLVFELRFNLTTSRPPGVYRVVDGPIGRGDLVVFCLDGEPARLALERGYLPRGSCPSGVRPVLKGVAAIGDDVVSLDAEGVAVNDRSLPQALRKERDRHGRSLPRPARESFVLGPDEIWLHNPARDSWDSRYFGPVSLSASRWALARPVLTLPRLDRQEAGR